jgi:hypothetical protein
MITNTGPRKNPSVLHEAPLHVPKVGVWCGISVRRIIGPVSFVDNSERYINLILNRFFPELTEEERLHSYFEQDSAVVHTAGNSMATISDVFGDRVISEGLWPAHSSDIMLCDFCSQGSLKDNVYKRNSHILHEP